MSTEKTYVCRYNETIPIVLELLLSNYEIVSSKNIMDMKDEDKKIYFINNSNYEILCPKASFPEKYLFGKFINYDEATNKKINFHEYYNKNICSSTVPSIAIVGVGSNTQKFEIQCQLTKSFKENLYEVFNLTYNPEGILYGFDYYHFPKTIKFPDIVYSLNNTIQEHQEKDIHIFNIAGGLKYINKYNKNCYGALVSAYLQSTDIDIILFTVNTSTPITYIKEAIHFFNFYGITNVFIVISDYTFDEGSYDSPYALGYYLVDKSKRKLFEKELKQQYDYVFTMDDISSGKVYNIILDLM